MLTSAPPSRRARLRPLALAAILAQSLLPTAAATSAMAASTASHAPANAGTPRLAATAPTIAEVVRFTQPLVRARLRVPDSLHAYRVTAIQPLPDDPTRFRIDLRFRARSPFGAITEHGARFLMKASATRGVWIVTTE